MNKQRMKEIKSIIKQKEDIIKEAQQEIDDEIIPGAYGYDTKKVEELRNEINQQKADIEKLNKEYEKLENLPTRAKIEKEIKELKNKIKEMDEELKNNREQMKDSPFYAIPEEIQDLTNQKEKLKIELAKNEKIQSIMDEIDNLEKQAESLEIEIQELKHDRDENYKGAYFIPDEVIKEIQEKEKLLKDLKQKIKNKTEELWNMTERSEKKSEKKKENIKKKKFKDIEDFINSLEDTGKKIYSVNDININIDEAFKEFEERRQDMFDKYYGDKDLEAQYIARLQQYKSHIITKDFTYIDENGQEQKGKFKTVEDYDEKEYDENFLQLEEFKEKLERLTKYQAGDKLIYGDIDKDELNALVDIDKYYIETNNSSYNTHKESQKHLQTLGTYGEKTPYIPKVEGHKIRNILRGIPNAYFFIRNHTLAPLNKFVGTKIIAPIHSKLYPPEKVTSGPYRHKKTHRYEARKQYYRDQGYGFIRSRLMSIFKAEQGDIAVLAAGAYDIKESIKQKYVEQAKKAYELKRSQDNELIEKANIEKIREKISSIDSDEKKQILLEELERRENNLKEIQNELKEIKNRVTTQTVQTDAIDMKTHSIRNKKNVTRVITGVKALAYMGIRRFIGPKIEEFVNDNTRVLEWKQNGKTTIVEQDLIEKTNSTLDPEQIQNITIGDLLKVSKDKTGDFAVPDVGTDTFNQLDKIRGIAVEQPDGTILSLADGKGFDLSRFATGKIPEQFLDNAGNINLDTKYLDLIAAAKSQTGTPISAHDIINEINNLSKDGQKEAIKELFTKVHFSKSSIDSGIPLGWTSNADEYGPIIEGLMKDRTWNQISAVIPNATLETVENGKGDIVNMLLDAGLSAAAADMVYNNLRKTKTDVKDNKKKPRMYDEDYLLYDDVKPEDVMDGLGINKEQDKKKVLTEDPRSQKKDTSKDNNDKKERDDEER